MARSIITLPRMFVVLTALLHSRYGDETFDLIYAISVFTHLTEELGRAWIAELRRLLRPGGLLMFTVHGRACLPYLTRRERAGYERGELIVQFAEAAGANICAAYHPEPYVERLTSDFEVLEFAPADPSASAESGPNDLSLFMLDGKDPCIKPVGVWDGMGLRGNSSTPVKFDRCIAPEWRRLGGENAGFSMLFAYSLPIYQVGLAACYVGIAQSAYDTAVAHVKKRIHTDTNQALAKLETVQRYVAEMRVRIDLVRGMVHRVAQMSDNALVLFDELHAAGLLDEIIRENPDDPFFVEIAQVKAAAAEMAVDVAHKALQVCGGTAYKRGHPCERAYRDARAGSVMAPSDDTLKLIVGRQVLGIEQPWE